MKSMRILPLSIAWLCAFIAGAQSPAGFQLVIDPPGDNTYHDFVGGLVDPDGGILMLGGYQNIQEPAFTLAKYDTTGQFLWCRKVEATSAGSQLEPRKVVRMSTGDLIVFGTYAAGDDRDYFITRMDSTGAVHWTRTYRQQYIGFDYGFSSIVATSDDELVVSMGLIDRTVAMRLDLDGEVQWSHQYITDLSPTNKNPGFDFTATADGGVLLTQKAEDDIYLVRLDVDGGVMWARRYPNGGYCHTHTAILLEDGGFLIAGSRDNAPFAARIDQTGGVIWQKEYAFDEGYVERFEQAMELSGGGFLLTSSANSSGIMGLRIGPLGVPEGVRTIAGNGYTEILGRYHELIVLGGRTLLEVDGGFEDAMLLLGTDELLDLECLGGNTGATATDIAIAPPIFGCNVSNEPIAQDTLTTVVTDLLIGARILCASTVSIPVSPVPGTFRVYPSPVAHGEPLMIAWGTPEEPVLIEHVSADGRATALPNKDPGRSIMATQTSGWGPGIHLIRATGGDGSIVGSMRVVVE